MEELPGSLEHGFELILGKLDEMMAKLLEVTRVLD